MDEFITLEFISSQGSIFGVRENFTTVQDDKSYLKTNVTISFISTKVIEKFIVFEISDSI